LIVKVKLSRRKKEYKHQNMKSLDDKGHLILIGYNNIEKVAVKLTEKWAFFTVHYKKGLGNKYPYFG